MEISDAQKKECCKEEQKQLKLQGDQKITEASILLMQSVASATTVPLGSLELIRLPSLVQEFPVSHAPPRSHGLALYKRYRVFRI